MTTPNARENPSRWPELYLREHSYWQDARRILSFILVLTVVFACVTLYIAFFAFIHPEQVLGQGLEGRFQIIFTFVKGISTLFLPIVFIIMGFVLVMRNTGNFFKAFYKPPEDLKITKTILSRVLGVPPLPPMFMQFIHYPFVVINIKDVAEGKFVLEKHPAHWLGGPFTLVILDGAGVYLQRGSQFSRSLGPGIYFQERFETLQEIVDLRRQTIRSGKPDAPPPIQGRTKDGIKIKFNVEISFHILRPEPKENSDQDKPSDSGVFAGKTEAEKEAEELFMIGTPLDAGDPEAIRKAVERTTRRRRLSDDDKLQYSEAKWQDGVWGTVSGELAKYITKHYLDELLVFESSDRNKIPAHYVRTGSGEEQEKETEVFSTGQLLSGHERERICEELDSNLRKNSGVTLTDLRIVDFDVPPVVHEQRFQFLRAELAGRIKRMESYSAAEQIRIREKARTRAQQELIKSVSDSLESLGSDGLENYTDAVLLTLSNVLSQGMEDPTLSTFLASETFDTLEQLREYLSHEEEPDDDNLAKG